MALPKFDNTAPGIYDAAERSAYAVSYLRDNIRVGFTDERGPAWWAASQESPLADGTHFPGAVPIEEVEKLLNITLEDRPLFYMNADGEPEEVTRFKGIGIVGRKDVVNVPSSGYVIHQYMSTLHDFTQQIMHGDAATGSVGILKHGAVAFLQAVMPESLSVAGYEYTPYVTAATSADSSVPSTWGTGALGAICDNTLSSAMAGFLTKHRVKHTKHSRLGVQAARDKLGIQLAQVGEDMGATIEALTNIEVSERDFELWLDEIAPMPEPQERTLKSGKTSGPGKSYTMTENKRDELARLWSKDPKVKPWTGNAFGIVQAWNTWNTWESIVRNAPGGRIERNMLNAVEGKTGASDRKALEALASVQERKLVLA